MAVFRKQRKTVLEGLMLKEPVSKLLTKQLPKQPPLKQSPTKEVRSTDALITSVITGVTTVGLASVGTLALVGAHHLGRKQYDKNARLSDYAQGLINVAQKKVAKHKKNAQSVQAASAKMSHNLLPPTWISGVADLENNSFAVVAIDTNRNLIWRTPMPERVHDILIQTFALSTGSKYFKTPRHVTVMGRRPSEYFWVLNNTTGKVLHTVKANVNRHYYGHACYSLDGKTLYVTENDTVNLAGKIGVYDVFRDYKKVHELDSHGIGPHELLMHPDGDTLVIANGGIKTERASRDELNLDSMQPSLVYLNRHTGQLLEQIYPEHNQMSVRHLTIHDNGTVIIGIQFQGERHLHVPLVLIHQRDASSFTPLTMPKKDKKGWHRFHHYIASVCVDSSNDLLCVTSPIGGVAAVFDLVTQEMVEAVALPDCAGVALGQCRSRLNKRLQKHEGQGLPNTCDFLVSDGQGYLTKLSIDKHHGDIGKDDIRKDTVSNDAGNNDAMDTAYTLTVDKVYSPMAFDNHLKRL